MDVLRRSARKSRLEGVKNETITELMEIDVTEQTRLRCYGHVEIKPEERLPILIMKRLQQKEGKEDVQRKFG